MYSVELTYSALQIALYTQIQARYICPHDKFGLQRCRTEVGWKKIYAILLSFRKVGCVWVFLFVLFLLVCLRDGGREFSLCKYKESLTQDIYRLQTIRITCLHLDKIAVLI